MKERLPGMIAALAIIGPSAMLIYAYFAFMLLWFLLALSFIVVVWKPTLDKRDADYIASLEKWNVPRDIIEEIKYNP